MKEKEHKAQLKNKLGELGKKKKKNIDKSSKNRKDYETESSVKPKKENNGNPSEENLNSNHIAEKLVEDRLHEKEGKEQLLRRTTRCLDENIINTKPKNISESNIKKN